jgi:pyruvoyl-dependent arginine decarboxylase (PvlArgDC)
VTNPAEGQTVSYVGIDSPSGLRLGDHGRLLAYASRDAGHIQWLDGARRGQVDLVELADVAPSSRRVVAAQDGLEDSLEVGPVVVTSTRTTYDVDGGAGVLTMMASTGRLANFDEIADEALTFVQGRIAQTSSVREVLAQLDDEEGAEVLHLASITLLHDAFGGEADDE